MKKIIPVVIAVSLLLLIACGMVGFKLLEKYMPTKEEADLNALYQVEDGQTTIFYNYEMQDAKGIYENGQTYLPISWVNQYINKRFYWDNKEQLLVYTLPNQIVYADAETKGSNGSPLLLVKNDQVYLTLGLIANYSDVQIEAFDGGAVRRVFLTDWGTRNVTVVQKDGRVREKGGIKSPIVAEIAKDSQVTVLETMETWSEIMTADGHMGYIENKYLGEIKEQLFASGRQPEVYAGTSLDEKVVLGWHQVTNADANQYLDQVLEGTEGLNVISPTWFSLTDNNGGYKSLASKAYVDRAHELGLQVWALLDNFSDDVQTEVLLSSTSTRRKLINSLMEEVETYNLDGLNMDFEELKPEAGVHYIQFLRELSIPCREKGIVLSVDNYVPIASNKFYDRKEQGIVVDYVIIMGYDEHFAGSAESGSVASIGFVREGIEKTLEEVPAEKVINAVPFYTRLWKETPKTEEEIAREDTNVVDYQFIPYKLSSEALGMSAVDRALEVNGAEPVWNEECQQYYAEYVNNGITYKVWMEEERSIEEKAKLLKEYNLAGIAAWKLGLERSSVWDVILKYVN